LFLTPGLGKALFTFQSCPEITRAGRNMVFHTIISGLPASVTFCVTETSQEETKGMEAFT
jgi:hypothetical protein